VRDLANEQRISTNQNYTISKVDRLKSSFELDLIAFYKVMQDKVMDIFNQGIEEGWTPDEIIAKIESELRK
jgi:elongation factor P hydroxylase